MCSKRKSWGKSLLALLLVLALGLTACGGKKDKEVPVDSTKESEVSTELPEEETPKGSIEVTEEPEEIPEVEEEQETPVEEEEIPEVFVLEDGTTLLFEGGAPDMGYNTEDVEWFMTAPDDAVFTVVYSCNNAEHVDWGVAGWIANVEGVEMKGPELYAHKEDATKKVYVTFTVKELKECLQITEGKIVGNLMLGAWNGGQISELYITTDGKLPKINDAEKVEFRKKIAVDTSDLKPSDMTGNYMFVYNDLVTIDFRTDKYCPGYVVGDTIQVEVKMESDGGFLGCFGTCVGSDYAWHMEEYKSEVGEPITVKFEITPSIDTLQFQTWWMGGTKVGVSSVSITTVGKVATAAPAPAPAPSYPSGGGTNVNPGQGNTGTTDNGVIRDYKDVLAASNTASSTHMDSAATVEAWGTALTIRSPKEGTILDASTLTDDNYFVVEYVGENVPVFKIPKGEGAVVVSPCDTSQEGYAVYSVADMKTAFGTPLADVNLILANTSEAAITINSMKLVSTAQTSSVATVCEVESEDFAELISRPGKVLISEPVTCEPEKTAFTLFDPYKNSFMDLAEINDRNFHIVVEYSTAYPPGLAVSGPKNDWAKVAPCYVEGGKAVFSYAEMVAAYGSLEDVGAIVVWNKTDRSNLTVTEVKTFDVEVAEDANAVDDAIYRGSAQGRGWEDDNYMTLGASHFADVAFDGSRKLVITYVSTYLSQDTMFQLASGDYGTVFDSGLNVGKQANFAVKEFVLTEKYASIAEKGLIVHGVNWTITKIMIDDVETKPEGGEGQDPEGGEKDPLTDSVVLNDTSWWTQINVEKDRLLCGQKLENIEKITFSSTGNFVLAYNNLDGSGKITEYNKDPHWSQIEGASSYELDLSNINFENYNFVVALSNNEGVDYTITWNVVLKEGVDVETPSEPENPEGGDQGGNEGGEGQDPEGGEPTEPQPEVGKGSLIFTEQTGWIKKNITKEQLFCGVELDQIAGFKFSSTTDVYVGFNGAEGGWIEHKDQPTQEVSIDEIDLEGFAMELALWNETTEYTITWEVVLKTEPETPEGGDQGGNEGGEGQDPEGGEPTEPQPEVPVTNPTGSLSFDVAQGWIEKEITKDQLLCGLDAAEVAGFKFTGQVYIYVGFNGVTGAWTEYKDQVSHEIAIEEIDMNGFGMKLALWNENAEHTITWEVIRK